MCRRSTLVGCSPSSLSAVVAAGGGSGQRRFSNYISIYVTVYISIYISVYISVYFSIYLSTYDPVLAVSFHPCLPVYLRLAVLLYTSYAIKVEEGGWETFCYHWHLPGLLARSVACCVARVGGSAGSGAALRSAAPDWRRSASDCLVSSGLLLPSSLSSAQPRARSS